MRIKTFIILVTSLFSIQTVLGFGFHAHRTINRMAVFALPPEMIGFFKKNIDYISEHAIDPDKRSRGVVGEAEQHYIDIENWENFDSIPKNWFKAVEKYTEDTLRKHGINPWHVEKMLYIMTNAFKDMDRNKILFIAANFGHYIADACTPLHTTKYYDGKNPYQKGIHSFWESRLPELFAQNYDYFTGRAKYIDKPNEYIWMLTKESHLAIDTIFTIDDSIKKIISEDKRYSYESRGSITVKVFSYDYSLQYHLLLNEMVEKRMLRAVKAVSDLWLTAWVNAGQPNLDLFEDKTFTETQNKEQQIIEEMWKTGKIKYRHQENDTE